MEWSEQWQQQDSCCVCVLYNIVVSKKTQERKTQVFELVLLVMIMMRYPNIAEGKHV